MDNDHNLSTYPRKRSKETSTYQGQKELKIAFSVVRTLKNNDCRDLKYLPTKNKETGINRENRERY